MLLSLRSRRIEEQPKNELEDGGPVSATFEHAKAITAFIQRFGTRVNLTISPTAHPSRRFRS